MANIVITGGAGFIGANLLIHFMNKFPTNPVISMDNLSRGNNLLNHQKIIDLLEDENRFKEILRAIPRIDAIIHCAAISRVTNDPDDYSKNIKMLMNTVMWAKEYKPKKLIFCSSSATWGTSPLATPEGEMHPKSLYGMGKLHGEYFLKWACENNYLECVISLRLPNVYGPGQRSDGESGAVAKFLENDPIVLRNPAHIRDYVFIDDIVRLFDTAIEYAPVQKFTWIPIGSRPEDECVATSQKLIDTCVRKRSKKPGLVLSASLPGEMADTIQTKKNELGWSSRVKLTDGIELTWQWIQAGKPRF